MPDPLDPDARFEAAASLLGSFMQQHTAPLETDFEHFVGLHPECAHELRELWQARGPADRAWDAALQDADTRRRQVDSLLATVREPGSFPERYSIEGRLGAGGMGVVFRVKDRKLGRTLALKQMREQVDRDPVGGEAGVRPRNLHRFLDEARLTSQLDHPGIVPVHEIGLDERGRVFFTMKLVHGRDLAEVLRLHAAADAQWGTTRIVGLLQRACEAVAYAHERGVIHRDLKPGNIRIGDFGEVFVMDWGLARGPAVGEGTLPESEPAGAASEARAPGLDPLAGLERSREGQALGTPAYMSPEQARGERELVGVASDVYSLGAILYELLAGIPPYGDRERAATPELAVFRVVREGPSRLANLAASAPRELVAICERAMARDPRERYSSAADLASDLRAYLEGRVVLAYETGPWAELRKWVRRNPVLTGAFALVLVASIVAVLYKARGDRNERLAAVTYRLDDVERLLARADELWPPLPGKIPELEQWLVDARRSVLGSDGLPGFDEVRGIAVELEQALGKTAAQPAAKPAAQDEGSGFVKRLRRQLCWIDDPETGVVAGMSNEHGWGIEERIRRIRETQERTLDSELARARWREACASIADRVRSPRYGGLMIEPQYGLLPLQPNERGLWEFAYLLTGFEPASLPPRVGVRAEDALTLVLLPGGTFQMGAQKSSEYEPQFDPYAQTHEAPVHSVELAPFFISKFEMTQAQWLRIADDEPSRWGANELGWANSRVHPVEQVTWDDCNNWLTRMGLEIPTEAQWEYSTRGGTHTVWPVADVADRPRLRFHANLSDEYLRDHSTASNYIIEPWSDGYTVHAPVGTFAPDNFGLHDTLGNVQEWCRDGFSMYTTELNADPDGYIPPSPERPLPRIIRGGSWDGDAVNYCRSAARTEGTRGMATFNLGVRPALRLEKYRRP